MDLAWNQVGRDLFAPLDHGTVKEYLRDMMDYVRHIHILRRTDTTSPSNIEAALLKAIFTGRHTFIPFTSNDNQRLNLFYCSITLVFPAATKHGYTIYTTLDQRCRRRPSKHEALTQCGWADVVYKCYTNVLCLPGLD